MMNPTQPPDADDTESLPDDAAQDALYRVLHDAMMKDQDTSILLGTIQPGESEEIAAGLAFAEHTRSPVLKTYFRHLAMAKRAERAGFRKELFSALKTIGRRDEPKQQGFMQRFKGA